MLDLILDALPLRFYLVAAWSRPSVFVWEVAYSPGGKVVGPVVEFLHELVVPVPDFDIGGVFFVPNSDLLVFSVAVANTFIWNVRSGDIVHTLRGAAVKAVAPCGGAAAGTRAVLWPAVPTDVAVCSIRTGLSAPAARTSGADEATACDRAAFSPRGDRVALFVRAATRDSALGNTTWRLEIRHGVSGKLLCAATMPDSEFYSWPAQALSFDGDTVSLCRYLSKPGLLYHVRGEAGGCQLVRGADRGPCDDAFLPGELRLYVNSSCAAVTGRDTVFHSAQLVDWDLPVGSFSPDGRKVLIQSLGGESETLIWAFADVLRPSSLGARALHVSFAPDPTALVGLATDRTHALVVDLAGVVQLKLWPSRFVELSMLAVSGHASW